MLIGVDWGGTKIEAISMAEDGVEILRLREDTPRGDYEGCLRLIADLVARLEAQTGRTGSIGIGIPGSLDPVTRLGKGASSTWILGKPVERDLRHALGRDIRAENDADCLAASEARDGAGAGFNVVFAPILGSGVGGGLAVGGRAHHGPNNSAAEWGHNPLPMPHVSEIPGAPCYCGKYGCVETWCSGRGFEADYARHTGEHVKARTIMERMRGGEVWARQAWERYVDRAGRALSVVINTLDPDIIVVGGGMSNVDELYADLPAATGRYTFSSCFRTPIVKARHGDSSGVRGAAWLWMDESAGPGAGRDATPVGEDAGTPGAGG
jgi:fructokinase